VAARREFQEEGVGSFKQKNEKKPKEGQKGSREDTLKPGYGED